MILTVIFIVAFLICGYLAFKDDDHDEWRHM